MFSKFRFIILTLLLTLSFSVLADSMADAKAAMRVRDYEKAVRILYPLAKKGDMLAQYQLGILIRNGQGAKKDPKLAADWLLLACKQGYDKAQYALGMMYLEGNGIEQDNTKASKWLDMAAKQGHQAAKIKLEEVGKVDVPESNDINVLNAKLEQAVLQNDVDQIAVLIKAGANVEFRDQLGNTPLIIAAQKGHTDSVRTLLKQGARVSVMNKFNESALMFAAGGGYTQTVAVLLQQRANVDDKDNKGVTALMYAAREGHNEVVQQLLKARSEINATDKEGLSAYVWAEKRNQKTTMQLLAQAGATIQKKKSQQKNPAHSHYHQRYSVCELDAADGGRLARSGTGRTAFARWQTGCECT